jgi:hypothetical protein
VWERWRGKRARRIEERKRRGTKEAFDARRHKRQHFGEMSWSFNVLSLFSSTLLRRY